MRSWRNRTASSRSGLHHQQALVQRRRQSLRQRGRRLAGRRLHDAQVDLPAEAGHDLRRRPRARRQGLDPRHQQPGGLGPAEVGADGRDVPPPPGGGRGDEPLAAQGVQQLHRLVRVAVGMRCDRLDELRRRAPVRVHHLGDQADRGGHGQVVEVQVLHVGPPARPRQRARQRVRRIDVVIAVGTDQQQPVDRFFAQQEVEQAERGAAGPLQVVDEEHHRPLGRRDRAQDLQGDAPRPHLRGQRVAGVGRHGKQRGELGDQGGGHAGVRSEPRSASGRGPRPARPPARQAAADPARGTPGGPRRTRDPGGTGRTCRPRTSRPCRSPPAAAGRPAPSCPPPAPRRSARPGTRRHARPRTPPAAPPPRRRGLPATTAAATAAGRPARRPAARPVRGPYRRRAAAPGRGPRPPRSGSGCPAPSRAGA